MSSLATCVVISFILVGLLLWVLLTGAFSSGLIMEANTKSMKGVTCSH